MIDVPVLVKDALREGSYRKDYRFVVYQADGATADFTIDNNKLISESVAFDERMCSDTELKFGLCEGTNLEFQCFNTPNITGRRIQAFIDVEYDDEGVIAWHTIPMGWYTVEECSRQASTGNLKIKCYNKLLSDYLDAKANSLIADISSDLGVDSEATLKGIMDALLEDYQIMPKYSDPIPMNPEYGTQYWYFDNPTFKLVGSSTNYHFVLEGVTYFLRSSGIVDKRLLIQIMDGYINRVNQTINALKTELQSGSGRIQNFDAVWSEFKKQERLSDFFGVTASIRGVGTVEYIADEIYDPDAVSTQWSVARQPLSKLKNLSNVTHMDIGLLNFASRATSSSATPTTFFWNTVSVHEDDMQVVAVENDEIDNITIELSDLPDVTLRDLVSANYELRCAFGRLERTTDLFSAVELNHSRLYPADDLYPANDLYPLSYSERSNRAMYSKLWADEGNVRSFRYLIITYKGAEVDPDTGTVSEVEKTLQRTVNEHGTDNYNMSDNWLFRNLVWDEATVGDYADAMVEKLQNVTWFPFEMWCAGLPYIETGDEVEINMDEGAYTSYVLRRTLKGIQNLQDQMINGTLDIF